MVARKELAKGDSGMDERAVLELLQTLKHPNFVDFLGSYRHNNICSLLFPVASMNLHEFMSQDPWQFTDLSKMYASIYGLADGLDNIHNFTLQDNDLTITKVGYHHDLRPANILVHRGVFMIADFGLSKLKPDDRDSKTRLRGGQDDYLGPESFDFEDWVKGPVGRALDVWSLGCILTELATFIESKDVASFRNNRKATHGIGIRITDYAFHLYGKVRPAVTEWLENLVRTPKDLQVTELIRVASDMLNPNPFKRPRIAEITPRLKFLAIDSIWVSINELFRRASQVSDESSLSNIQVFIVLEHKRMEAWRTIFGELHYGVKYDHSSPVLASLQKLHGLLKSGSVFHDTIIRNASELSKDFIEAIDSTCKSLPSEAQEKIGNTWARMVCEIEDLKTLDAIRSAHKPERYRSVGIGAAMKYMSVVISNSIHLGTPSRYMDSGAIEVDELPASLFGDRSKTMGYYTAEGSRRHRILIEWKEYTVDWKSHGDELRQVMDDLTNLLDPNVTPRQGVSEYRVLNSIGYFHEKSNHRFGFVYDISSTAASCAPTLVKLFSLNNVLRLTDLEIEGTIRPALGDIFLLAKDLASCLSAFHQAGWLHKKLSSHQVLVLSPSKESVSKYVRSAVLAGFDDSRPEASSASLGPNQEFRLYRHPKYTGGTGFRRTFDYFSLGIILLELGLWNPIFILRGYHPDIDSDEEFRAKLLKSYVPQLSERVGTNYESAVRFCLDADNIIKLESQETIKDHAFVHKRFGEMVVEGLSRCCA